MSAPDDPRAQDLAADLAGLLRTGVTVHALRRCEHVLHLAVVRAKSASDSVDDRAVAAEGVLREVARAVDDGDVEGPHSTIIALAPGFRGSLLKQRRPARQQSSVLPPIICATTARTAYSKPLPTSFTPATVRGVFARVTAPILNGRRSKRGSESTGWSFTKPTDGSGLRSLRCVMTSWYYSSFSAKTPTGRTSPTGS